MRHENSVFHALTKFIPWGFFDDRVEELGADRRVRKLTTKGQLLTMLWAQLGGLAGLRETVATTASHANKLYHLGLKPVKRSTLSDANAKRPAEVFMALLARMMAEASPGLRRKLADIVHIIDSTSLRLAGPGSEWAAFSADVCGAKLHMLYDPDAARPLYAGITAAKVNDITAAKEMPITRGATYVFDLGYYDYSWWAELDQAGCRIITRFKTNTPLMAAIDQPVAQGSPVLSDRIGFLPLRQAKSRKNPMQAPVREVRVATDTGKVLRILTNDLDAPAEEIAELYKLRWAIELFFRWVKQTLRIKHFFGRSENAVRIQVAVALIAYLVLSLARAATKFQGGPLAFARLVRTNLLHRRPLDRLHEPHDPPAQDSRQLALNFATP